MATINEIKASLDFTGKMSFFTVKNKEGEITEWARATDPITGVFVIAHVETVEKLTADRSISTLFLKRKPDVIFEDGILHKVYVLCIGAAESLGDF